MHKMNRITCVKFLGILFILSKFHDADYKSSVQGNEQEKGKTKSKSMSMSKRKKRQWKLMSCFFWPVSQRA